MFCGTSSFHNLAGDDAAVPKTSRKKKRQSKSKNPYSSRGLDKFTSVLSDLESRREKIMASTGAQGIAMIRFMYSNSQDWIPIIVRLRDDGNRNNNHQLVSNASSPKTLKEVPRTAIPHPAQTPPTSKKLPWWRWRSSYCLPVMVVMLLVCLVIFGRVFAICCTSIWWYLVPILQGEEGKKMRRRVTMKKDYVKKMSDKRLLPPPAVVAAQATGSGLQMLASPRAHGNNGKKG